MNLEKEFEKAQQDVASFLPEHDRLQMLKLYALFKQATQGDTNCRRPPMTKMVKRVQWDAWQELAGTPKEQAMQEYIALVNQLRPESVD